MQQQAKPGASQGIVENLSGLSLQPQGGSQDAIPQAQHDAADVKRERGPPSLRTKRSQRFTVASNAATSAPPVPPIPVPSQAPSSVSSASEDADSNPPLSPSSVSPGSATTPTRPRLYQSSSSSSTLNPLAAPVQPFQFQSYHSHSATSTSPGAGAAQRLGARGGQWPEQQVVGMHQGPAAANSAPTGGSDDDDVIPTAIVIKNIPFSVKREQLLAVIEDLMIPLPYAFNYHFDQGIFRGLAFANFRLPSEADSAVVALNGYDLSGRKLRVEYKKVLQAGEKERIEKEKAIKRMRSLQMQKEQEAYRDHQFGGAPPLPRSNYAAGEEDYGEPISRGTTPYLAPSSSAVSPGATSRHMNEYPFGVPSPSPEKSTPARSNVGSSTAELDMNDPQTLEMYSRILLFKDDAMRDNLEFSKTLSASQRRLVHQVAKKLGLEHRSEGAGEDRRVVVYKPGLSGMVQGQGKGRQGRSTGTGSSYLSPADQYAGGSGLRKKSMPDMRGSGQSAYLNPGSGAHETPSRSAMGRRSQVNLREGYASLGRKASHHGQPPSSFGAGDVPPPVPSFGGSGPPNGFEAGHFGGAAGGSAIRQPRGPDAGKGFGDKMRNLRAAGAGNGSGLFPPASPAPSTGSMLSVASGVSSASSAPIVVLANSYAEAPSSEA